MKVTPNADIEDLGPVKIIGFAFGQGRMKRQFVDTNCQPSPVKAKSILLMHSCDTGPGLSGAPLIAMIGSEARLVAIHTARSVQGGLAVQISGISARTIENRLVVF